MARMPEGAIRERVDESARLRALPVHVERAQIEPSGLRVLHLSVADESDADPASTCEVHRMLSAMDAELATMDAPSRPAFARGGLVVGSLNGVSARLYHSEGLARWVSRLVAGGGFANVLLPHQERLLGFDDRGGMFAGAELSAEDRRLLLHALDGRAARARARVQQWLAARTLLDVNRPQAWATLGCAASLATVGALRDAQDGGADVTATFFDTCDDARSFVARALRHAGVEAGRHGVLDWRLASREGLAGVLGEETQDLVDLVSPIDMLPDGRAARLLRDGYAAVRPGGVLVFAVTRADRPLRTLVEYGIGWNGSHLRSVEGVASLLGAAGIDVRDAMVHLTPEGVHAVIEVRKL